MGIRVNKFLGYGFTDLVEDDPRVNWKCGLLARDHTGLSGDAYFHWLGERRKSRESQIFSMDYLMLRDTVRFRNATLLDTLAWDPEYGLESVLALRPLCYPDWERGDDSIDYVTETWLGGGQKPRADMVPAGIHPFNGRFMDARTGGELPQDVIWFVRLKNDLAEHSGSAAALDEAVRSHTPFGTALEAAESIVSLVPEEIRDICEFTGLLTAPDGWKDMRPLLYTWWA